MLAEYGLALLAVVCVAANGQDLIDAEWGESRPPSRAPGRFLTDEVRYSPNCPAGYWDKTYGNALSWACGRGCPGGAYTWNDCSCACIFGTPPPTPIDTGGPPVGGGGNARTTTTRRVIYSTSSWTFAPTGPPPEEPDDDGIDLGMVFAIGFAGFAFVMICSVCLAYGLIMYSRSLEEEAATNTGPKPRVVKAMSYMGKGLDQRYQSGRNFGRRFSMDMLGAPGKQLMRRLSMTMGFGGGSKQEPVARMLGPDFETDANGEEKLRVSGKVDVDQAMVTGVVFYPYKEGVPTVEQRSQPITPQSGVTPRSHISGSASHRSGHSGGGGSMGRVQSDGGAQMSPMLSGPPTQRRAISATPTAGEPQRFISSSAPIGAFSPSGGPRRRSLSPSHQGARRDSRGSGTSRSNQQPRRPSQGSNAGSHAGSHSMGPIRSNRSQQPNSPNMGPMRSNRSQQPHNPSEPYSQGNMGKMPSNRSAASAVSSARPVPSQMSRNASPTVPGQMSRYASPNVAPSPNASRGLSPSYVPGAVHASPRGGAR